MKNILLIQFRTNQKIATHERKCFFKKIGKKAKITTKNILGESFSFEKYNLDKFNGIILGGSGEVSLSEKEEETFPKVIKEFLLYTKKLLKKDIPILGVCFGHHILGNALGINIINDDSQKEVGTFRVSLINQGKKSKLFKGMPDRFLVQEGHKDSLEELPEKGVILAKGDRCKIQAFKFKNAYGVQFHPELDKKDVKFRLKHFPDYNEVDIKIEIKDSPLAGRVLNNFVELIY